MQCPYCKKELSDEATFCPECGQALQPSETDHNVSQNYWNDYKTSAEKDENKRKELEISVIKKHKSKRRAKLAFFSLITAILVLIIYIFKIMPAQSYSNAQELFAEKQYSEAAKAFTDLGDYKDAVAMVNLCKYNQAIIEYENGQYEDALSLFYPLIDYENSRYYAGQCELQLLYNAQSNDIITLGNYQGTAIEWIIISKNESEALLVSTYYIDTKIANESDEGEYGKYTCWSGSTLRQWLNNEFISSSFSAEVAALLLTNNITTNEYDVPNYDGWSAKEIVVATEDKVYIPSMEDIENYGLKPTSLLGRNDNNPITGWLRDRGHGIAFQVSLEPDGSYGSEWHFYSSYGIRPIIKVSLK